MSNSMEPIATVKRYLSAMEKGDLAGVADCFEADGFVVSPVYGNVPVAQFYERLFADTVSCDVGLRNIYASVDDRHQWAAHFAYTWRKRDGSVLNTELVDLFEFGNEGRIKSLSIVFNPNG